MRENLVEYVTAQDKAPPILAILNGTIILDRGLSIFMGYLETTAQFYAQVAQTPEVGLCCVQSSPLQLPGLNIPEVMHEMNYGCGSTVHPAELINGIVCGHGWWLGGSSVRLF
jgi:hypothetical protein